MQNLPLWIDEGLAEYHEVPRGTHGFHPQHMAELNKLAKEGRWKPDIRRLEEFRSPAEMTETDYAESWAWMHWLLETEPARAKRYSKNTWPICGEPARRCRYHFICDGWAAIRSGNYSTTCAGSRENFEADSERVASESAN